MSLSPRAPGILLIDDEPRLLRLLRDLLREADYATLEAPAGRPGIALARSGEPDLIILDLGLPDMHGVEVVKALRGFTTAPILILSATESPETKVAALDAGADDYLIKPFHPGELLARVRAALRRPPPTADTPTRYRCDDLDIDFARDAVLAAGKPLALSATEFALLRVLAMRSGRVVSHEVILREIWGAKADTQRHYLRVYVSALRKKLTEAGVRSPEIETRLGVGYQLAPNPGG